MDPLDPTDDVNDEGNVTPSENPGYDEPLPGQPEPGSDSSFDQDVNKVDERTVPLRALQEERTKKQELQAELEILRQIAGDNVLFDMNGRPVPNPNRHQPQQQQQQQSNNPANQEIEKLWETDPRKAVQVEIMAAMSWRDNQEVALEAQMSQAEHKYPDFHENASVIRQYVRSLPVDQRAKPGIIDLAYFVVKGQNAGNAVERAKAEMLQKMQAGQTAQGLKPGTKAAPKTVKGVVLNDEQMKVADAMGLTNEQYISAMKQ